MNYKVELEKQKRITKVAIKIALRLNLTELEFADVKDLEKDILNAVKKDPVIEYIDLAHEEGYRFTVSPIVEMLKRRYKALHLSREEFMNNSINEILKKRGINKEVKHIQHSQDGSIKIYFK